MCVSAQVFISRQARRRSIEQCIKDREFTPEITDKVPAYLGYVSPLRSLRIDAFVNGLGGFGVEVFFHDPQSSQNRFNLVFGTKNANTDMLRLKAFAA
jgi:hypothetical protein